MMQPFFKRFVQLARQDSAKAFNAFVADELEISVKIMEDLKALKKKILRGYHSAIKDLTTKYAPLGWKYNIEVSHFEKSLDDFIETRKEQVIIDL